MNTLKGDCLFTPIKTPVCLLYTSNFMDQTEYERIIVEIQRMLGHEDVYKRQAPSILRSLHVPVSFQHYDIPDIRLLHRFLHNLSEILQDVMHFLSSDIRKVRYDVCC